MTKRDMALTPKQQRFVEEYLCDLNATQAAIRAGYSKKTAYSIGEENLNKPEVFAYLAELRHEQQERTKIDSDWVLRQSVELRLRCMQEIKPIINSATGEQATDEKGNLIFRFDAAGAARALELVGKHIGVLAFKDRIDNSSTMIVTLSKKESLL